VPLTARPTGGHAAGCWQTTLPAPRFGARLLPVSDVGDELLRRCGEGRRLLAGQLPGGLQLLDLHDDAVEDLEGSGVVALRDQVVGLVELHRQGLLVAV